MVPGKGLFIRLFSLAIAAGGVGGPPASAAMITANYAAKYTLDGKDVTAVLKADFDEAICIWKSALPTDKINLTLNVKLQEITDVFGDPAARTVYLKTDPKSGFITQSDILFNNDTKQFPWFLDPTPQDDKEFKMTTSSTSTNSDAKGKVNSGRFGEATAAAAKDKLDFLSVAMHEVGHALGIGLDSGDMAKYHLFKDKLKENDLGNFIDVSNEFAGLFPGGKLPVTTIPVSASHLSDDLDDNFKNLLMLPSGGVRSEGFRVLPSDLDILAIGSVYALKKNDISLNPQHCPEPATFILALGGLAGCLACRSRRRIR